MPDSFCVILTTTPNQAEADRLAELLVSRRLAACVQISPIASCYMWQGNVTKETECLLLIKTAAHLYSEVEAAILENHSYEIPEIVQLPVAHGSERYLAWIGDEVKDNRE
jgi:periplasmic divalent cation tolerance protein